MFIGICHHDAGWGLLKNLVDSLERCGCTHNCYVFVNTHGEPETNADYIRERLPNSEFLSIDVEQRDRIPVNKTWAFFAKLAKERQEDWFFLDDDIVFFAKNAIDILYDEFIQKNCRMCGALHHDPAGIHEMLPPVIRERAGGLHSIGVAFYDKDILELTPSVYNCPDAIPYDVWCKDHFLANFSVSAYHQHRFCSNVVNLHELVFPEQFFHHGCKDDTLWKLVLEEDHWAEVPEAIAPPEGY